MKETRKKDCAAKSDRDRTKENFARKSMWIAAKFCSRRRTKENFTRKSMGIAATFYYARSWLILPGMVKNHDWQLNQSDDRIL